MAQKVKIALLPCPCCGGSAEYTETSLPDAYSDHEIIACTECHLQMDNASPREWNRRVQSAQQSMHLARFPQCKGCEYNPCDLENNSDYCPARR